MTTIDLRETKVGHEAVEIGVYRDNKMVAVITRPTPRAKWHVHPANFGKKRSFVHKRDAVAFAIEQGGAMDPRHTA